MENTTHITKAGPADIPLIRNLALQVWPQTYQEILSPDQISYMLELFYSAEALGAQMKTHTFLVIESEGQPVGFASYGPKDEPGVYKLHKLYVLPGLQGKGVGRVLINAIVDAIRPLHARALDLNVNRRNRARFFYERTGFVVLREEDIDIGNGFQMNDYVMRLELNQ